VDIGGSGARLGIVDGRRITAIQREAVTSVDELIGAIKKRATRINGIAISVAGFVHGDSGRVTLSRNAGYLEGELKARLESSFPAVSIHIVNDGEAHALALLKTPNLKLGAINIALGTSVAFGVLGENGRVVRSLSGGNWDIGDLWVRTSASDPCAWWALGQKGLEELERKYGDGAYDRFGYRLGSFASQLATIFRPNTIGFSGGIITKYWSRMEKAVKGEFRAPLITSPTLIAQQYDEPALIGLSTLFNYHAAN
jgi:predicted NBD/HSP70 family sugar kinase